MSHWTPDSIPDQTGRTALITGARTARQRLPAAHRAVPGSRLTARTGGNRSSGRARYPRPRLTPLGRPCPRLGRGQHGRPSPCRRRQASLEEPDLARTRPRATRQGAKRALDDHLASGGFPRQRRGRREWPQRQARRAPATAERPQARSLPIRRRGRPEPELIPIPTERQEDMRNSAKSQRLLMSGGGGLFSRAA